MIENEDDWLVTFSKRRLGIYKKKSELCTLCGNNIFFIIFSFARKPFAYGHPSIESIANHFLNGNISVIDNTPALIEAHRTARIYKLIQLYNEV
uniref:MADS-box domain-containing protein n=1 Tax=Gossypium raimondii TaxID=29730 RepID=A0A0D2QPN3_GOSRA|nr:hypothetical protein B456_009G284200 [Gossypium raimondii]